MKHLKRFGPQLLLILIGTWFVSMAFGDLFWKANDYLFIPAGDGLKNYFSFAHYVKYGGDGRFTAMTYPYGEFALLTDGHFALASLLHWVDSHLFDVSDYSIGILNFLMLFSLAICPVFIYLILRRFGVSIWFACLAGLVIGFLSPQVQRYAAHYSLSYAFFLPMVWYFLLRMMAAKRPIFWAAGTVLAINFFGFLHPYYVPLAVFFLLAYGFIYSLQHLRNFRKHLATNLWIYGTGLAAILIFMTIASLGDPVTDRHPAPYGIFTYFATFESVFLPSFGPVLDLWKYFTLVQMAPTKEGMAYVGVFGVLILAFTTIRFARKLLKRRNFTAFRFTCSQHLNGMLWAATLMLLLATAFPFLHFEFLLGLFPPFKQFRSLGRFAWVFYYVFTVYAAYYLYLVYRSLSNKGNHQIAVSVVLVAMFFWGADAFVNVNYASKKLHKARGKNTIFVDTNRDYSNFLKDAGYAPEDFQAMLAFPYFNNGSEKFYIYRSNKVVYETMKSLYDINVPVASFLSPRTSLSHSYKLAQLVSSDLIEKEILPELNEKPFLILRTKEKLKADEEALIKKAERIYSNKYIELYKLPMSAFETRIDEVLVDYQLIRDSIPVNGNIQTLAPQSLIRFEDYEAETTPLSYDGKGALYGGDLKRITFFEDSLSTEKPLDIECSVWIYADSEMASFPALFVEVYNEQGGRVKHQEYNPKFFMEYSEGWVKATVKMPYKPGHRLVAYMKHENRRISNFIADNFMIRPADTDVWHWTENGGLFYNNYKVSPELPAAN
ncbi:MAG: hypothetical protein AAF502_09810 [Bacteroidota bacterium]